MTVIADKITDVALARGVNEVVFSAYEIRDNSTGTGVVIKWRHQVPVAVDGSFTTPGLDPGPATVKIGVHVYDILIPDAGAPIRLWPLIDASLPSAPADPEAYVRNAGGVRRIQRITQTAYTALTTPPNSPDPDTLYAVVADN